MTWKRIVLLFVGFFLFLLGTTYVVLQETGAAQTFVRATLTRFIAADWVLRTADVSLADGIVTLEDFQLTNPVQTSTELVTVDRVELDVETNPLGDVLAIQAVRVIGLDISLDLAADRLPTLSELLNLPEPSAEADDAPYPPVLITESRMTLGVARDTPPLRFENVDLRMQPQEQGSSKTVLSGHARCANFEVDLEISGEGDVDKGQFRGFAKASGLSLGTESMERIRQYLPQLPVEAEGAGHIDQLVLWFEYSATTTDAAGATRLGGGFRAELSEVSYRVPSIPYTIAGAKVQIAASTRDDGNIKFAAQRAAADGSIEVTGTASHLRSGAAIDVRAVAKGLLVGSKLAATLRSWEVSREIWDMFRPTAGRLDAAIHLRRGSPGEKLRADLDLDLDGVALAFHGLPQDDGTSHLAFPLPLQDARGHIALRNDVLTLQGVHAYVTPEAGGGRIDIEGFVELPTDDHSTRPWLDIRAPQLRFSPPLRAAVASLLEDDGALYDDYSPDGAAAVHTRIRPHDVLAGGWQVKVQPLGATATYRGFPYRIADVHGTIDLSQQGVLLDLAASRDAVAVEIDGRFLRRPESDGEPSAWRSELWVKVDRVPLDPELRTAAGAFSGQLETLWRQLSPTGDADVELSMWRDSDQQDFTYDLRMDLVKCTALPEIFPLPIEDIHGAVFVHGTGARRRVDLSTLRGQVKNGRRAPATLALAGTMWIDDGLAEDLTAVVRGLDLNSELAHALDVLGTLRLAAWEVLKPSGTVDLVFRRVKQAAAELPDHLLTVQLRDVRSDAEMLPQPATSVTGEVTVENGLVEFSELRCLMGTSEILCDKGKVVPHEGDESVTEVEFTVRSDRFPVNDDLTRLFHGPLRQTILDRQLSGSAKVHTLTLKFLIPPGGDAPGSGLETRISGQLEANGVEMLLGTRVDSIGGLVNVTDGVFNDREGWVEGSITTGSFRVFGHPCFDFKAGYLGNSKRITFRDLSLRLHNGFVRGRQDGSIAMQYDVAPKIGDPGTLSMDVQFQDVNLRQLLDTSGAVNLPYHGFVSGWLDLKRLRGIDFVGMEGEGRLEVRDGDLGTVPLFTTMYSSLQEENRPKFDGAEVDFEVVDRMAWLRNLVLRSPLITVTGEGAVAMDGYLDITLAVERFFSSSADVLVLPPLINAITAKIVRFHLYGYPRQINLEQRWFTESHPRRPAVGPIPAPATRPVRRGY